MNTLPSIAFFFWDPSREAFTIPYFGHPIVWYGICFVMGFMFGYYVSIPLFCRSLQRIPSIAPSDIRQTSFFLVDRLCWFAIAGTIIGARLGHVFFYDWDRYKHDPWSILKTWEGGLASHGGAIGVLIALYAYKRYINRQFPSFSFLELLDNICIPTALVGFFIRIGNFINQEILGTPTTLPWGVVFGHPSPPDRFFDTPRHPVQLYEAFAYLALFAFLVYVWKKGGAKLKTGLISGLFFTLLFSARFLLEFFKVDQDSFIETPYFQIGQYLSIPFILAGTLLIFYSKKSTY
jgi:phosphatidylglycerol---prolipoprotein diacylglyceryl transferase